MFSRRRYSNASRCRIGVAGPYYLAEDEHQQYLAKHPGGYCNHGFCQVAYQPA